MAEGIPPKITIQSSGIDASPISQGQTSGSAEDVREGHLYTTNAIDCEPPFFAHVLDPNISLSY